MQAAAPKPSEIRVMIVDDSSVVRGLVTRVLEAEGIKVVSTATSAATALTILKRPAPHKTEADVIILDVQMQDKGGLGLVKEIKQAAPGAKIIMAGTLNEENVMQSLEALDYGADELVAKPSSRKNPVETKAFVQELLQKVKKLSGLPMGEAATPELSVVPTAPIQEKPAVPHSADIEPHSLRLRKAPPYFRPKALAIASSTGGPKALQIFFEGLGKRVSDIPIFLTQHMPKDFTTSLAAQIGKYSGLPSSEGMEGEKVEPGRIYVAPGDYHMLMSQHDNRITVHLDQGEQENFCRPAADPMLRSLLKIYGKDILVVVLTGMGQDGMLGAKMIADSGGVVVAQDKESSVVWGMPGAVAKEGVCTHVLPLNQLADAVVKLCHGLPL